MSTPQASRDTSRDDHITAHKPLAPQPETVEPFTVLKPYYPSFRHLIGKRVRVVLQLPTTGDRTVIEGLQLLTVDTKGIGLGTPNIFETEPPGEYRPYFEWHQWTNILAVELGGYTAGIGAQYGFRRPASVEATK